MTIFEIILITPFMNATVWNHLVTLVAEALELPENARSTFLDRACEGDSSRRAEVDSLLQACDSAPDYFAQLAENLLPVVADDPNVPEGNKADDDDPFGFIGKRLHQYQILEKLGDGGMGIVYKAEDTLLKRPVALKFLPPLLGERDDVKQRFFQEAQAASALDHPNICTIFEIKEAVKGQWYIAMAFYEGKTLKEIIRGGALPRNQAIGYALQIGRGLRAAHQRGIIHRDIKPANLILTHSTDGNDTVKIVDFGLARLGSGVDLTKTGAAMGTAAYMSPEQARGTETDHRTDIWSFGVVLYEMIAGERPFPGDYAQAALYAIANEDPQPLSSLIPDVDPALEQVIYKTLAKDPNERFSDFGPIVDSLEAISVGKSGSIIVDHPVEKPTTGIVILPFVNISSDIDQEFFCDGLTEELIIDLSQVESLRVISRTSTMMLKGSGKDPKAIGEDLNVPYVLEGGVRKVGDQYRITAQLINTKNNKAVWSNKFKGTLEDVFDIQEHVSRSIVDALKLKLSPEEHQRIAYRPITDARAYECYLQARHVMWQYTEKALDDAIRVLKNGLNIVGDNVLLYATIGYVHWQYVNAGIKPVEHLRAAEPYVEKIFALEPDSPRGHHLRGLILVSRGQVHDAVKDLQLTIDSDPTNPDALLWLSILYGCFGRTDEAYPLAERLIQIDPLTPLNQGLPGWLQFMDGNFDRACIHYQKMVDMEPTNPVYGYFLVTGLAYCGKKDEAIARIDQMAIEAPGHPFTSMCLFFKHALLGEPERARSVLSPELEAMAGDDLQYAWFFSVCYSLLGETDDALDWLTTAIRRGFSNHKFLSELDPFLASARTDPKFQSLMKMAESTSVTLRF